MLEGVDFKHSQISVETQLNEKWKLVWQLVNKIVEGRDLSKFDLRLANLSEAHLNKANLSEANLEGAILKSAYLQQANLWGAK